ncbi:hypothetical protein KTE71_13425 [Burkholderia multivorans]|uniref:hypothetical protein n=1 Tax=Burkholderia multivorans TaxID=87883 RepID=UPI001C255768|nr:hypothetical protein [Burkholderia multivorans]MBU9388518.1 hypothetical protein [Burkholderia multivorans]MDN8032930.1 hypothetical protein [Burkholderia multivorans]
MSRIQKAVNDLATTRNATFETKKTEALIDLYDNGSGFNPIRISIAPYWFGAADLRQAAKLFKKLAEQLEAEGRAE